MESVSGKQGGELPQLRASWLIAGAAALTLVTASRVYLSLTIKGIAEPPLNIVAGEALRWALWLPAVPAILTLERRWGFLRRGRGVALGVHAFGFAVTLLTFTLIMTAVGIWAGWYFALDTPRSTILVQLVHEGPAAILVYSSVVLAAHARRHFHEQEARRLTQASLETRLARERLRNLQMQLHPHFLFNALHAVGGIMRDGDRKTAVDTLDELGELLRRSLSLGDRQFVTLEEELDFIGSYLKIQSARYGSRLNVRVAAETATLMAMVPNLILQPLVENAIRHGTSRSESGGTVLVNAIARADRLRLEVTDDGPQPISENAEGGVGLRNVRERLIELYNSDQTFQVVKNEGRGTTASIDIPFRLANAVERS